MLNTLLDHECRLGTSTPGDDPGGDYAFAVFEKADRLTPGAGDILQQKALTLVGGRNSRIKEGKHSPVHTLFAENMVDAFLGYKTTALDLMKQFPRLSMVDLPEELSVHATYGITVRNSCSRAASALAAMTTPELGPIMESYGFSL